MIQNASPDLYQAMQQIAEQVTSMMRKGGKLDYIHSLKCGGKTKKKENGGKAVRTSKCGCMLKRVGGRIVEIDTCTGKMKNGGSIMKFQDGGHTSNATGQGAAAIIPAIREAYRTNKAAYDASNYTLGNFYIDKNGQLMRKFLFSSEPVD
jgi:hypothetical protein